MGLKFAPIPSVTAPDTPTPRSIAIGFANISQLPVPQVRRLTRCYASKKLECHPWKL